MSASDGSSVIIVLPSPVSNNFEYQNDATDTSPLEPNRDPSANLPPKAWARSWMSITWCAVHVAFHLVICAALPNGWSAKTVPMFSSFESMSSTRSGSMVPLSSRTSQNTGIYHYSPIRTSDARTSRLE